MKQVKHFTFSELVVVSGVVLLGTALIVPVLSAAAARARSVSCAESQKNLGIAHATYAKDNNDLWVQSRTSEKIDKQWAWWTYILLKGKYVNVESLICPTAESKITDAWAKRELDTLRHDAAACKNSRSLYYVSYGYNFQGLGGGEVGTGKRPNNSKSGRVIVVADAWDHSNFNIKRLTGGALLPYRYTKNRFAVINPVHEGKTSVLWSDGSSTQVKVDAPNKAWSNEPFSDKSNWLVKQ